MFIDTLRTVREEVHIVIAEIRNSKKLTQDDIIRIAANTEDVLATQFLDSKMIIGIDHLLSAAQNALNAFNGGYMLSRSLSIEIAVYASAQRQISRALEVFGVSDKSENLALVMIGYDSKVLQDKANSIISKLGEAVTPLFQHSRENLERIQDHFGIEDVEIQTINQSDDLASALAKCIVNRISLVAFDA